MIAQKISPCLWFDQNAREAIGLYTGVFKDCRVYPIPYFGEAAPIKAR